ncbi:hypothetical protein HI914_04383 [Erysiphe necator]|uniref:Uncharacterized protein n=1 Tax=Uncinula necator TaxID=52586 RepID=A0A0B1P5I8_UNCNE|nr:hypothetical protein HI914_04383 [Erysiphe necator]KHJ32600.1 hypothetical protein EV44_g0352 [Erysiphe necator]
MRFNLLTILFALFLAIVAQEAAAPPPDDFITKTQTSTTTLTYTVTVSLIASVTMTPPLHNITLQTGAYPTATNPSLSLGPFPTDTKPDTITPGKDYNIPTPPKETSTFVPDNSARYVVGSKALIGAAGLLTILAVW